MQKPDPVPQREREESSPPERLDSWKEIAAYLKRDIRTLHRWEREEGLPVHRHLHKKRDTVYAYRSEVDAWWKNWPSRPARIPRKMLAVLPFENLSGESGQEYFSDGLTEEMITQLGQLHPEGLGVIARTSVMQYKRTLKDVGQIGRELGVEYVLEGSVRRAGERVRVSAQLIQVSDQTHLWAESYDRHLTDMLTLQGEVAQAVTQKIGIKLTPPEQRRILRPSGIDHQAYDACLQGRFHWHQLSRYHFDTALQYFELALNRDPNYALAHEGVAAVWLIRGDNGVVPPREALPNARAAITRAMELDGTLADVHKTLANLLFLYDWDWRGAEAAFQQAIALNPSLADVHLFYADLLIATGRADKWKGEIQRALEIDPFNFFLRCFLGWHLVYLMRYEEAIAQFYETLKTEPSFPSAHMGLWGAFYQQRKYDQALKEAKTFFAAIGDNELAEALEHRQPKRGYTEAMHRAAEILEARTRKSYVPSIRIARLYAHAEAATLALDSLEKAYEQREPPLVHLTVGWDWDKLRDSPRFQRLVRRMNFPS